MHFIAADITLANALKVCLSIDCNEYTESFFKIYSDNVSKKITDKFFTSEGLLYVDNFLAGTLLLKNEWYKDDCLLTVCQRLDNCFDTIKQ
jgi:hypothetical protein